MAMPSPTARPATLRTARGDQGQRDLYLYAGYRLQGADSFTYTVSDGKGGSNTYTVAIKVEPVNDAPTASGTGITTD